MQRTIILEGAEGSGKSTLGLELSKRLRLPLVHTGSGRGDTAEFEARVARLSQIKEPTIFDRFPTFSEPVYTASLGTMQRMEMIDLWRAFWKLPDPLVIFCRPSDAWFKKVIDLQEVKEHKSLEDIRRVQAVHRKIIQEYDSFMASAAVAARVPVIWYNHEHGFAPLASAFQMRK